MRADLRLNMWEMWDKTVHLAPYSLNIWFRLVIYDDGSNINYLTFDTGHHHIPYHDEETYFRRWFIQSQCDFIMCRTQDHSQRSWRKGLYARLVSKRTTLLYQTHPRKTQIHTRNPTDSFAEQDSKHEVTDHAWSDMATKIFHCVGIRFTTSCIKTTVSLLQKNICNLNF